LSASTIRAALFANEANGDHAHGHATVRREIPHRQTARREIGLAVAGLTVVTLAAAKLGIRCPVKTVLGIDCPGCGGTRALAALARGDIPQAARENIAALVAGLATAGYLIAPEQARQLAASTRTVGRRHRSTRWLANHPQAAACLAAVLWCAARNLRQAAGLRLAIAKRSRCSLFWAVCRGSVLVRSKPAPGQIEGRSRR
jgi:hypothetical protein